MPLIAHLWALAGLAAVPGLLLVYFLYSRFRRREVSSLFLWRDLGRQAAGHGRVRFLLPPVSFWLEALLLLLLALAAAQLCWRSRQALRPLVVVLDDSFSMQAVVAGGSVRERAHDALQSELRRLQPSSVRLVLAGRVPRVGPRLPPTELGRALATWHCRAATADLDKALLAARTHAPDTRVLVLTDHPPTAPITEPTVKWLALGRPAANAGIVNAVRTAATATEDRVLVEVRVFGPEVGDPVVVLAADGRELHRAALPPAAAPATVRTATVGTMPATAESATPAAASADTRTLVVAVPAVAGRIRAVLTDDALPADNLCELPQAWRPRLRVELLTQQAHLHDAFTRAMRAVALEPPPAEAAARLLVLDGAAAPAVAPDPDSWLVRFHVPAKGQPYTGPFVLNRTHPLTEGLDPEGLVWCGDPAPGDGLPVLLAGDVPLVRDTHLPGGAHLLDVALDPERSTLLQSPAWPVLVWNLLHWRARAAPGFGTNRALCGQWVRLVTTQTGARVRLVLPDGRHTELRAPAGDRVTGFVPDEPGLYRAECADGAFELSCLPGVPEESDLGSSGTGLFGGWDARFALQTGYWSSAALCGLLAAALLALHGWWVYGRGRGRAAVLESGAARTRTTKTQATEA